MAKIVVIVRTRNEEKNIKLFCSKYRWADNILIADGMSEDNTRKIASKFSNVKIKDFDVWVDLENGIRRNPEGKHINFLLNWANNEKADWIILDDCDCAPNAFLERDGRKLIEECDKTYLAVTRIFVWGTTEYFPDLSFMQGGLTPSIWAIKGNSGVEVEDTITHYSFKLPMNINTTKYVYDPYCILHYAWRDEEEVQKKTHFYLSSGQIPGYKTPIANWGGRILPLAEWMLP